MSRLYEALTAIGRKAHVPARTDLPHSLAEGPTRHRWSAIALGAVAVLGAAWLTVMPRAPAMPSPSAPPVSPLLSAPPPQTLRGPELRERARSETVLGSLARAEELLERAVALDPADVPAWNDLGVVLVRRGQRRRGIAALEHDGQALGAAAHYRAFLELVPEHPDRAQIEQRLTVPGPAAERR